MTTPFDSLVPDEPPVLRAPPDPATLVMRQMVQSCIQHASQSERLCLMPMRDAKMNGIIQRQGVLLQALALLMDEFLASRGEKRSIEWRAVPANGAGVVEPAS